VSIGRSSPESPADAPTGTPGGPDSARNATAISEPRFRVGQRVRTSTRSKQFHDRVGTVVATHLGEVGVAFSGDRADAWFLPRELTKERA
jgi:hypothetical protein